MRQAIHTPLHTSPNRSKRSIGPCGNLARMAATVLSRLGRDETHMFRKSRELTDMTCRNEDSIVRRSLIALLIPGTCSAESDGNPQIRKSRFCRSGPKATVTTEPAVAASSPARIFVIEQLTSKTISVCWSDPQSGHYADQVWRSGISPRAGSCVLTGLRIYPGDRVYRPRACKTYAPANRDRMMLAAAVHGDRRIRT